MFYIGTDDIKTIKFNGNELTDLKIVSIGDEVEAEGFGITRSTSYSGDTFLEVIESRNNVTVTFVRSKNGIPLELTDSYLKQIQQIFFRPKGLVKFEIDDRCYYAIATEGSFKKYLDNEGYFSITLEVDPYCYVGNSTVISISNNSKTIVLENTGLTTTYIDLSVECVSSGRVTITKDSNTITLEGTVGQTVEIYGEYGDSKGTVKWDCSAMDVFQLAYGENTYTITGTGKWNITFNKEDEL